MSKLQNDVSSEEATPLDGSAAGSADDNSVEEITRRELISRIRRSAAVPAAMALTLSWTSSAMA